MNFSSSRATQTLLMTIPLPPTALRRPGCTPPWTWSTLTSDFSLPNHRKDMKFFCVCPEN